VNDSAESEDDDDVVDGPKKARRGRSKQPVVWSRVLKIKDGEQLRIAEHEVFVDVQLFLQRREQVDDRSRQRWKPLFHPKTWALENPIEELAPYELSERQLMKYGKEVTRLRKEIRDKASVLSALGTRFDWKGELIQEAFEIKEAKGYYDPQTHVRKAQLR
jgi:hypothetical protein